MKVLNAVSTTTTCDGCDVSKRQLITIQFIGTGVTTFTVDVSNDKTNWVTSVAFLDSKATAVGTFVTSKAVNNSTEAAIITPGFAYIRVVATVSTGTATAILQAGG